MVEVGRDVSAFHEKRSVVDQVVLGAYRMWPSRADVLVRLEKVIVVESDNVRVTPPVEGVAAVSSEDAEANEE